jgi:hypothetical protein
MIYKEVLGFGFILYVYKNSFIIEKSNSSMRYTIKSEEFDNIIKEFKKAYSFYKLIDKTKDFTAEFKYSIRVFNTGVCLYSENYKYIDNQESYNKFIGLLEYAKEKAIYMQGFNAGVECL